MGLHKVVTSSRSSASRGIPQSRTGRQFAIEEAESAGHTFVTEWDSCEVSVKLMPERGWVGGRTRVSILNSVATGQGVAVASDVTHYFSTDVRRGVVFEAGTGDDERIRGRVVAGSGLVLVLVPVGLEKELTQRGS